MSAARLVAAEESSKRQPNVVIFLADDAGWGDYGHNGNKTASTPNIDRLAQSGASFDRFFVCPVCAPTRAEFLTGRYHLRSGVSGVSTGQERMSPREKTLADAFHAAGYATGAFGKWHNGSQWPYHPLARGFDEYYGYTSGHWGEYFDPPLDHNGKPVRAQGYIVDRCTDQAIDFIDRHKDRPFLCYVPFTTPHSPWAVPNEYWEKYSQRSIEQPATVAANEKIEETRCVHAMLENQDWNVGRVLKKLRDAALEDNTIVVYFSDNGPNGARWNGGMKGTKGSTDEGGIRSTCLIRYPNKIAAGTTIQPIAGAIDLLPTITSLAGVQPVSTLPLDGRDMSPWLLGQQKTADDRMLFTAWGKNRSVRSQRYRLDAQGKLFDMIADPGQTHPVDKEIPEVAGKFDRALEQWNQEVLAEYESQVGQKWTPRLMDPRPISVGYRHFPRTWLPARDGVPLGNVERSASAPNSSYFVQWTSREDAVQWDVELSRMDSIRSN
ncbi:MAG: arylsulfatase [Pirellulales bacterium]